MLVGCVAKTEQLKEANSLILQGIRAVASISIGAYAALVFAEALDFMDAVRLDHQRGQIMKEELKLMSDNKFKTGLVSIRGPNCDEFRFWLTKRFPSMDITACLEDNLLVVGGKFEDCKSLEKILNDQEEAKMLPFSDQVSYAGILGSEAAFHTHYMKPVEDREVALFDQLKIRDPIYPVIMNSTGKLARSVEDLREDIRALITRPVMLRDGLKTAYGDLGIRKVVEVSPSATLASILADRKKGSFEGLQIELARF